MGSVITIANQAGSAGKTTTAVTLAGLLAASGRSVRVIDLDSQANATFWLGSPLDPEASAPAGDVLLRRRMLDEAVVETATPGLSVLPATARLDDDAAELSRALGGEQRLRQALQAATPVDVTLIDCPGSLSVLTIAALVASDAAITVATPTIKELAGLPRLEQTIAEVAAAYNPDLRLVGVVPCIVPSPKSGRLYSDAMMLLADSWGHLATPPARRSVRIPEAYSRQTPLHTHAPSEPVTADYQGIERHLSAAGAW